MDVVTLSVGYCTITPGWTSCSLESSDFRLHQKESTLKESLNVVYIVYHEYDDNCCHCCVRRLNFVLSLSNLYTPSIIH